MTQTQPSGAGLPGTSSIDLYKGASMLVLTDEEKKIISAPVKEADVDIRRDGLVYLPQVFWREKFNTAFGLGQWCIIPLREIRENSKLYLECILMIRGHYVATAMGEAEMDMTKLKSFATIWEAAKSDGITRCGKDLGIAKALWEPEFISLWKQEYAVQVWVEESGRVKQVWRKKNGVPLKNEREAPKPGEASPIDPAPPVTAYNHRPMAQNGKPVISNENFKKVCERLRAGELKVYESTLEYFSVDQAQLNLLDEIKTNLGNTDDINTADDITSRVTALWAGKLDKCKTAADLEALYQNQRHTIDANSDIKNLYNARREALKS